MLESKCLITVTMTVLEVHSGQMEMLLLLIQKKIMQSLPKFQLDNTLSLYQVSRVGGTDVSSPAALSLLLFSTFGVGCDFSP